MNALQGIIRNGQIFLDAPAELPEGTRVEVLPIEGAKPTGLVEWKGHRLEWMSYFVRRLIA